MAKKTRRVLSEVGSLPLALLVTILVAGLVVVLVSRTISAQSQVRYDEVFHGALPGADAAIQISKARLNLGLELDLAKEDGTFDKSLHPRNFEVGDETVRYSGEVDEEGRSYSWTMKKIGEMRWRVDATAFDEREGVERRVLATIEELPLVDTAAFAEVLLHFQGANTADSYNSTNEEWCTGRGWVGSNEDVEFSGGATSPQPDCDRPTGRTVDRVMLHDWANNSGTVSDPDYPGGDRCDNDSKHANCTEIVDNGETFEAPRLIPDRLELGLVEDDDGETTIDFIERALDECADDDWIGGSEGNWRASDYIDGNDEPIDDPSTETPILDSKGRLTHAPDAAEAMISPEFDLEGGHYCANSLTFDRDVQVSDDAGLKSPVIIFVKEEVILDRGTGQGTRRVDVGCPADVGCHRGEHADQTYPEAASLIIFVLEGQVALRNHSQFAGVMYAPKATCRGSGQGGGSNAQADIYGSMVCDTITNAGGWRFHFDDALANLYSGEFVRTDWREVARGPDS